MAGEQRAFGLVLRGYQPAQVDALCARVEWTLAGGRGPEAVTADEIRHIRLDVAMRGYSKDEVDAFLDQVAVELHGVGQRSGTDQPAQQGQPAAEGRASSRPSTASFREASELFAVEARPRGERFTHAPFLQEGYVVAEVDRFVEYARSAFSTRLRAMEVADVTFETTRRGGYDVQEVDRWLDRLRAALIDESRTGPTERPGVPGHRTPP